MLAQRHSGRRAAGRAAEGTKRAHKQDKRNLKQGKLNWIEGVRPRVLRYMNNMITWARSRFRATFGDGDRIEGIIGVF